MHQDSCYWDLFRPELDVDFRITKQTSSNETSGFQLKTTIKSLKSNILLIRELSHGQTVAILSRSSV